ncbi:RND superfamily putative drug exporter [Propionicimonas paludicola]|uniref:RND superfamily putative drug exporter n=1 Tax=Propionicimonas paludicola TaxID=185243 RepID=A0A2A9CUL6_9ACTN|nr:MMPL family transporter [Propionicimonas paludicola]PFG18137.1 RND superfamily putative drug exporter [Propionicimonas paludicola]
MSSFLYRIGRASYRARGRVVAAWLLVLVVLGALAFTIGGKFDDSFRVPNAASTIALDQLKATFPEAADATATVLITVPEGSKLEDPAVKKKVETWLKKFDDLSFVRGTVSPYNEHVDGLISSDGRSGRVTVRVNTTASLVTNAQREQITEVADSLAEQLPGTKAFAGGEIFGIHVPHLSIVEALGLGVAVLVLLVTLGSFVASMMPIGSAITGVGIAVMITQIAAGVISVSSTTLMLAIMLGLAVGIDYALFILSRHRDQLASGMDVEESAARAVGTAGSAVVFAGLTVIIALVGLSIAGLPFLSVMGIFAAVGVAVEVLLALTMLPAFLGFAGDRLRPKAPKPKKNKRPRRSLNIAGGWVKAVTKWPLVTVAIVLVGLGALAIPTKDLYLALPTSGRSLPGTQDRVAADEITKIFGAGANGPLIVTANIVESDDPMKVMDGLKADIEAMPGVKMVATSTPNANADTGMVQVIPTTGPDDPATATLVQQLRDHQGQWKSEWGVDTAVTGFTAVTIDVTERLRDALLPFGIFVVGLSLVLLTMVFRSVWVPIKAALGYLLSLGGAFGATTLVFNQGWFRQAINLPEAGPVISFLPIIGMGILFGLAMDYEVFLVSRMREEYVHGSTTTWVEDGFVHSAKVVAAAGGIMFAVFAFFVPNGEGAIKPIAFALAVGVALDAFVVRMTLVPAVMKLLGRHAWWLPKWLDRRLPSLDIEGESLARQLELADWPAPGDTAAVVGQGLSARLKDRIIFDQLELRVEPGEVLVIEAEPAQRRALLMALSGRLKLTEGRLKVLGLVLPEEAPVLRPQAAMLSAGTADFERLLGRQHGGLVCVDSADDLSQRRDTLLTQALSASADSPTPITWLLGVSPGAELDGWLPVPYRVLHLASHRALEGASK